MTLYNTLPCIRPPPYWHCAAGSEREDRKGGEERRRRTRNEKKGKEIKSEASSSTRPTKWQKGFIYMAKNGWQHIYENGRERPDESAMHQCINGSTLQGKH
jgi:hypothetical protein